MATAKTETHHSDDTARASNNGSNGGKLENGLGGNGATEEKLNGKAVTVLSELDPEDDPKNLPLVRKWLAVAVISSAALCAAATSSIVRPQYYICFPCTFSNKQLSMYILQASSAESGESSTFHVSKEVAILGISLYVEGMGIGPLLLGPLSEFYGRNPVYYASYSLFLIFSFPVAFAPNISTLYWPYLFVHCLMPSLKFISCFPYLPLY